MAGEFYFGLKVRTIPCGCGCGTMVTTTARNPRVYAPDHRYEMKMAVARRREKRERTVRNLKRRKPNGSGIE